MLSQCWLHIGTEKTGTTSIRNFLAQNRATLLAHGYLYPTAAGEPGHGALTAFALDDSKSDSTRLALGIDRPDLVPAFRQDLLAAFDKEIAASGASQIIMSNELLSTRLRTMDELLRLGQFCDQIASNTKVVVYIRNQVDFLVSRYTNVILEGGTDTFLHRGAPHMANYAKLLERWSEVFGRDNILVRRFEPADFRDGDLLADFAGEIGFDDRGFFRAVRSNPSLDEDGILYLRALNKLLSPTMTKRLRPYRARIAELLQRQSGSTRLMISNELSDIIETRFRASNEEVSRRYFGARFQPLFSPPLSAGPPGWTPKDSLDLSCRVGMTIRLLFGLMAGANANTSSIHPIARN